MMSGAPNDEWSKAFDLHSSLFSFYQKRKSQTRKSHKRKSQAKKSQREKSKTENKKSPDSKPKITRHLACLGSNLFDS